MAFLVDARGLACPQPVVLAKKALEGNDEVVVLVDDDTALANVRRLASSMGCGFRQEPGEGHTRITVTRGGSCDAVYGAPGPEGPVVVVLSSETMGSGNDELGALLMRNFIHVLAETGPRPDVMVLFNSGVKLAAQGHAALEDLGKIEGSGARILVCGTCLDFYGLKERLKAGGVSNMYDIAQVMLGAGRLIRI
jgi:selenium metabolism protein YedF